MTLLRSVAQPAGIMGAAWFLGGLFPEVSSATLFLGLILLGLIVGVAWPGGAERSPSASRLSPATLPRCCC